MTYTATATMNHERYTDTQSAQADTLQGAVDLLVATVEARGFRLTEREEVTDDTGEITGYTYQTERKVKA